MVGKSVYSYLLCLWFTLSSLRGEEGKLEEELQESHAFYQHLLKEEPLRLVGYGLAGVAVLILCGWLLASLWRKLLRHEDFVPAPWGFGEFLLWLLGYLLLQASVNELFVMVYTPSAITPFLTFWLANSVFCLGLGISQWFSYPHAHSALGFKKIEHKHVSAGVLGYVLFVPFFLGSYMLTQLLFALLDTPPHAQRVAEQLLELGGFPLWLGLMTVVVGAPLFEEFLFRMFLYTSLRKVLPTWVAMILAAAIFALAHWQGNSAFILLPIFSLALFLVLLYEKTQSVWSAAFAHGCHNLFTLIYLYSTL